MKTNIKTTNISLSPEISNYIDKRLKKVIKILKGDTSAICDVEIARTSEHHQKGEIFKAELHLAASGKNCYSSSEKGDLFSAIDDARDELMRELNSIKGKRISLIRRSGARVKNMLKGLWPWGKK